MLASGTAGNYILLITDGAPNCNDTLDGNACVCTGSGINCLNGALDATASENCLDAERTTELIRTYESRGIKTLVVGALIDPPSISTIACPGHTQCGFAQSCSCDTGAGCPDGQTGMCEDELRPTLKAFAEAGANDSTANFYEVSNLSDLSAAISRTAAAARPCHFDLNPVDNPNAQLEVTVDEMRIQNDPSQSNGWYAENNVLTLYGDACAMIRDNRAHSVVARCID